MAGIQDFIMQALAGVQQRSREMAEMDAAKNIPPVGMSDSGQPLPIEPQLTEEQMLQMIIESAGMGGGAGQAMPLLEGPAAMEQALGGMTAEDLLRASPATRTTVGQ